MVTDLFYFVIFFLNIFGFTYYSFLAIKNDPKLFEMIDGVYSSRESLKKEMNKLPYFIMVEEALICVYLYGLYGFLELPYREHVIRILFALSHLINIRYNKNAIFVWQKIFHNYVLSYYVVGQEPLKSLFIHLSNNVIVNIIRHLLHLRNRKNIKTFENELYDLKNKKIATDIISILNNVAKEDNITVKSPVKID